jgi:hypothetical protein
MNIFRGQMGINQVGTTERFWWKIPGKGMWPSARLWGGKPTSASAVTGLLRFFWVNVNRIEDIEPSKASNPPIPPLQTALQAAPSPQFLGPGPTHHPINKQKMQKTDHIATGRCFGCNIWGHSGSQRA